MSWGDVLVRLKKCGSKLEFMLTHLYMLTANCNAEVPGCVQVRTSGDARPGLLGAPRAHIGASSIMIPYSEGES